MFFLTSRFHRSRAVFKVLLLGLTLSACAQIPSPPAAVSEAAPIQAHTPLGAYLASTAAATIGDYAAAADLATQALAADPEDIDLLRRVFIFSINEGRIQQSVQLARHLTLKDPNFLQAQLVLALVEVEAGQAAEAEKRLALFPRTGINNLLLSLVEAWIAAAQGKWDAAQTALGPLAGLSPLVGLYDYHMALISVRKGDLDEGETSIELLLKTDESLPLRIVELAGLFYETKGLQEKAKNIYDSYKNDNPETLSLSTAYRRLADKGAPPRLALTDREGLAEALFDVAYLLQRERQALESALFYTRLILRLRPDFPAAQMLLAEILEVQNRSEAALQIYRSINPESPFHWIARLRAAEHRDILGDTEAALADLRQMALERPERYDALAQAGDLLRRHDRFAEAITFYDRALARVSQIERRHASLLFNRGIALERLGRIERAVKDLQDALTLAPEDPYILNYLGYTWVDRGQNVSLGRRMLEKAVTLRPRDGAILDSLGWAFYRLDDLPNAVLWLERAIELKPADPTINDHLGDAYWRSDRKREAHFQWERSLKLGPGPHEIRQIEKKLKQGLNL